MTLLWRILVISLMFLLLIMEWRATGKARQRGPWRACRKLAFGQGMLDVSTACMQQVLSWMQRSAYQCPMITCANCFTRCDWQQEAGQYGTPVCSILQTNDAIGLVQACGGAAGLPTGQTISN